MMRKEAVVTYFKISQYLPGRIEKTHEHLLSQDGHPSSRESNQGRPIYKGGFVTSASALSAPLTSVCRNATAAPGGHR
jgi:hypothetical protein